MVSSVKVKNALMYKLGEVATRSVGNFLLVWRRLTRDSPYEGIIAGNQYFWTETELTNGETIRYADNDYIIRNSNPDGADLYYVECQAIQ